MNGADHPPGGLFSPDPLDSPHLADSTVWSKVRNRAHPELADWFNAAVREDLILTCEMVALELLRSARSGDAFQRQSDLLGLLRSCPLESRAWQRARDVQGLLAARGEQRGIPPADLLIAAAAELADVPVLHDDHDFERIAEVTAQPMRWLMTPGRLP